jgi:anti-sigma B factor antagonist
VSDLARIVLERRDAATVARLVGEVDMSNAARVQEELLAAADDAPGALVVDLTETDYLDSAWFPAMERVALGLARSGRTLRLVCPPSAPTRRLLELAGIETLFPLALSVEEALGGAP